MQLHQGHGKERDGMVCETEAERALCQARCIPGTEPEFCSSARIWVLVSQPGSVSSCLQSDFSGFVLRALERVPIVSTSLSLFPRATSST